MICYKCGQENKGGDKFCAKCGEILNMEKIDFNKVNTDGLEIVNDEVVTAAEVEPKSNVIKISIVIVVILVVVAAAIGIPQYYTRLKAQKIVEVTTLARTKISDYAQRYGQWPKSADDIDFDAQLHTAGMFDVVINHGVIEVSLPEAPGKTARIMPSANKKGRIVWKCDNGGITQDYLPLGCFRQ